MFNLYGNDRLTEWKRFRDSLETSDTPFEEVAEFWSHAPFVSPYLNPHNTSEWPDPWHLVLDLRLDDLAIALGMLYTIKLTQRFSDTACEIHMSMLPGKNSPEYWLIIDNKVALNCVYREVVTVENLPEAQASIIWSGTDLP